MTNFKFNWGHGVMLALSAFIIFILSLIFLADETGDLVSEQYYEDALVFQESTIDAERRAQELTEKPTIVNQANGIKLQFPTSMRVDSGQVYLMRGAFKADDILLPINVNRENYMLVPAAKLKAGEYDLSAKWFSQDSSYLIKKTIKWTSP